MSSSFSRRNVTPCSPTTQIVYIKTHKTASSTTANIIQRYGYLRNLTFALPNRGHIFSVKTLFNAAMVFKRSSNQTQYNIISNHLIYQRQELDRIVPGATYITILRDPVARFESTFGYYEIEKKLQLQNFSNPLTEFMSKPGYYYQKSKMTIKHQLRNGMAFSLGLPSHITNWSDQDIQESIRRLDKEFDLVLITDYYDESLLLLKKLMCWEWRDILYIPIGVRSQSHRYEVTESVAATIREWNSVDVKLYDHFNKTFWRKIKVYGRGFQSDLHELQRRKVEVYNECINNSSVSHKDRRVADYIMKENAKEFCRLSFVSDVTFTSILHSTI
jgi:hypothetical protein